MRQLVWLLLFFIVLPPLTAYTEDNCFPGKYSISLSRRGHELIWIERKSHNESHRLLYRVRVAAEPQELLTFDREVCTYWSPDDRQFAVTNYVGSNITETVIYETGDTSRYFDVTDLLPKKVRDYFERGTLHSYIEAVSWGKEGLVIRAFGDREEDPRSFDVLLKCFEERGTWSCVK